MSDTIEAEVAYPASWWENQTAEQLKELVRAGFVRGELFDGAQRELERRARESARQVDAEVQEEIQHHEVQKNYIALAVAAVSFIAATCALIWVLLVR